MYWHDCILEFTERCYNVRAPVTQSERFDIVIREIDELLKQQNIFQLLSSKLLLFCQGGISEDFVVRYGSAHHWYILQANC